MLALADHADHEGRNVRPSVGLVAWKTGYSERQVQRIMRALIERGVLVLERDATRYTANEYRIDLVNVPRKPARVRGDKLSPLEAAGVTSDAPGVTSSAVRGDIAMSPEPSEEPSQEPSETPPACADALPEGVTDAGLWRKVQRAWHAANYNPANVSGQLDWYRGGIPAKWRPYATAERVETSDVWTPPVEAKPPSAEERAASEAARRALEERGLFRRARLIGSTERKAG